MELKIYNKSGVLVLTASPNTSSSLTEEVGGECSVSATFTHTAFIMLDVDSYIELEGVRYKVKKQYRPKQKNTQTYEYSVKFYAPIHDAEDVLMLFTEGHITSEFNYDGGPREHLQLWIDNMNRLAGTNVWSIGTVISAENKTIEYKNLKCWDAAFGSNGIAATFETEMWADGFVINLCKASRGEQIQLGYLSGLTNLAQEDNGEIKFFTRLFPLGSTRNIDASKYGYSRLQLPSRAKYVDKNVDLYGVKEEYEESAFSGIYPKYEGTVSSVRTENKTNEEGRDYTVYYFKDSGMNFNPDDYAIPEYTYKLEFQTGELAGRGTEGSFEAAWHNDTKEWEIVNVYPDDTTQIPGGAIILKSGDKYIPWNFTLPQEYITAAEQAYKQAVDNYLDSYSFDPNKYTGTTDRNFVERNNTPLKIGWNVRLLSEQYFTGGYKDTRITKVVRKLNDLCQATITCTDQVGTTWKTSVNNQLNNLQYILTKQEQQAIIDIIKTTDSKTASDYNVFSALRSLATFLRKDIPDSTKHLLSLLGGAIFGEKGFAEGLLGFGAKIDSKGCGEMRRLKVWEELVVPLLVYNRVDVVIGDKWRSPGAGIIETVTPDTDEEGNELSTGTATLKLEDGEIGAIAVDDMAMGIWHFGNGSDATEDSDDSKGNFTFAGFTTAYWRITEVTGDDNKTFRYALRPGYTTHPQPQMTFSCRGNFTNEDRQKSVYETRTYTRMLHHQNEWEITASNIAMQYGDLSNLNVFGMNMEGYSMYLNSVYFTGTITQMKPDGTPIRTANDRGAWPPADNHADYFDRFSSQGCIWLCVNESGTTKAPGKNSPDWLLQVDKGTDGADGTSVKILGSFTSTGQLPASGNDPGDGYLIDGDLWVWDGSKFNNVGKIQGPAGESVKPLGNWYTGLHVQNLGVVRMWHSTYMCNVSDGTDNPPAWCWTDKDGNRFTFNDGGYALTGELNTAEYLTIATDGADAKSIINVDVEYAISTSNTTAPTSGWQTTAPTWENGKYIWSRTATYYSDDTVTYTDSACISGGKGIKKITEWYYRSSSATELIGGEWTTEYPGWVNGTYIWTKSIIEYTDGTAEVSNSLNATGSQGEGYTNMGHWHTDMLVPKLGVVSMGGSSWTAKVATRNPPLWCWTDKDGNRFTLSEGCYALTGEQNTSEYDLLAHKGEDGKDGTDGIDGKDGEKGEKGKDAVQYEYIFRRTTTYSQPSTPGTSQTDGYVPSGWTSESQGISATYPYEWRSQRTKSSEGIWSSFSTPKLWAKWGEQGLQGCIIRTSEWKSGTEYRNDSSLTGNTTMLRYIDVAFVRNNSTETGWEAYQCNITHVSSTSLDYTNTSYWTKVSQNVTGILASFIIAKNAKITFLQGNQLLIQEDDGTITAGASGSNSGDAIRFWAGSQNPDDAPFRVNKKGKLFASGAEIEGDVTANRIYTPFKEVSLPYTWYGSSSPSNMSVRGRSEKTNVISLDRPSKYNGVTIQIYCVLESRSDAPVYVASMTPFFKFGMTEYIYYKLPTDKITRITSVLHPGGTYRWVIQDPEADNFMLSL